MTVGLNGRCVGVEIIVITRHAHVEHFDECILASSCEKALAADWMDAVCRAVVDCVQEGGHVWLWRPLVMKSARLRFSIEFWNGGK